MRCVERGRFDRLSRRGYRLIALNVYDHPGNARYNAVWVDRRGSGYLAFHGVPAGQYQGRFTDAVNQGFAPVLVTATGVGAAAMFAAVFEQGVSGPWTARHGSTRAEFDAVDAQAALGGMALRSMAVYGTPADPRYAAVWHARPVGVVTHLRSLTDAPAYQAVFDAEASIPELRPRLVTVDGDTVLRNGRASVERAYTWSEPGTRLTGVRDRRLLASCSKTFVTAAVQWLTDNGQLVSTQRVYPLLGFSNPIRVAHGQAGVHAEFAPPARAGEVAIPRGPHYLTVAVDAVGSTLDARLTDVQVGHRAAPAKRVRQPGRRSTPSNAVAEGVDVCPRRGTAPSASHTNAAIPVAIRVPRIRALLTPRRSRHGGDPFARRVSRQARSDALLGTGFPITCERNGRQFIVIAVRAGDAVELVGLALPKRGDPFEHAVRATKTDGIPAPAA